MGAGVAMDHEEINSQRGRVRSLEPEARLHSPFYNKNNNKNNNNNKNKNKNKKHQEQENNNHKH